MALSIKIIQIGKTKDKFFKEAEKEFLKRLKPFAKIEQITLKESKKEPKKAIEEEGKLILEKTDQNTYIIVLERTGLKVSSGKFAELIKNQRDFGKGKITFIIGGPYGLSKEILQKANFQLSLSKMTFTHQMIRIFLLEQIYRAFTILEGKKYHY